MTDQTQAVDAGRRLGIVGAGKVGTALGRLALDAGWELAITDLPGQPMLDLIVSTVLPGARLVDFETLAAESDIVVLALPQPAVASLDIEGLRDVVLVDATNAWAYTDGVRTIEGPTTRAIAARNPGLPIAKTLNHFAYSDLLADARPGAASGRRAVGVAAEDPRAREAVSRLVDDLGFDPVLIPLADSALLEPDGPVFGRQLVIADFVDALGVPTVVGVSRN